MTTTPITERPLKAKVPRRSSRQRVQALMYLDLGSENGGFPINISEDGMSFQGIRPLQVDQEIFITFKLDGTNESITTKAKIVWLTETRKAGALQFVDMPEDSRREITEWIALQKEDEDPQEPVAPTPAPSQAKVEEAASVVSALKPTPSPAQVVPAAPRSLGTLGPAPSTQHANLQKVTSEPETAPKAASEHTNPLKVISKAQSEAKPSLPIQPSSSLAVQPSTGLAKPQQTGRFSIPPAKPTPRRRSGRSRSLEIGLAAFGAMAIVAGVLLWPSHEALLQRLHGNQNAEKNTDRSAATARMTAPPVSDAPMPEIPSDLPMKNPSQLTFAASLDPALSAASSQGAPTSARIDRPEKSAPVTRAANPGTAENTPFFSLRAMRPRNSALAAARNRQSSSAPPDSILENTSELPGAGASGGQMLVLQSRVPASPVTTIGSVEIISDPYPSIRMPADSQARASRLGASLQIGRLSSKVDPVYPTEAIRQRLGGKVRLHVVIDRMGAVESASILDGPTLLAESALRAVRQWRYETTTVGGEAVEIEQDVTLVFRVTNSSPIN